MQTPYFWNFVIQEGHEPRMHQLSGKLISKPIMQLLGVAGSFIGFQVVVCLVPSQVTERISIRVFYGDKQ